MSKRARMVAALTALARPVYAREAAAHLHWHPEVAREVLRSMARDGKCRGWLDATGHWLFAANEGSAAPAPVPVKPPGPRRVRKPNIDPPSSSAGCFRTDPCLLQQRWKTARRPDEPDWLWQVR